MRSEDSGIIDHSRTVGTMGRYQKKAPRKIHKENGSQTDLTAKEPERSGAGSASSGYSSSSAHKSTMFEKIKTMLKGNHGGNLQEIDLATDEERSYGTLRQSRSNPDISGNLKHLEKNEPQFGQRNSNQFPEHAVKVYRSDQSFRFLTVFPDTTAKQIVYMALQEFGMQAEANSNPQVRF